MTESFQAQRQTRQNRQFPRLNEASVRLPSHSWHAHRSVAILPTARVRSNMGSIVLEGSLARFFDYAKVD